MKKIEFFKVEENKITRIRKHCPKCGPAVFLAEHKNRFSCGKCGYTEFKGGAKKESHPQKVTQEPIGRQEIPPAEPHTDVSSEEASPESINDASTQEAALESK